MPTSAPLPKPTHIHQKDDESEMAGRLLPLLDLTALGDDETPETTAALCARAITPVGPVAAVCLRPRFVSEAKALLTGTGIRVVTVANFPEGAPDVERAKRETTEAVPMPTAAPIATTIICIGHDTASAASAKVPAPYPTKIVSTRLYIELTPMAIIAGVE